MMDGAEEVLVRKEGKDHLHQDGLIRRSLHQKLVVVVVVAVVVAAVVVAAVVVVVVVVPVVNALEYGELVEVHGERRKEKNWMPGVERMKEKIGPMQMNLLVDHQ